MEKNEKMKKKYEVEDPDSRSEFTDRPSRPASLENATLVLVALPGGGARRVGRDLAARLGLDFVSLEGLESRVDSEARLDELFGRGGAVAAVPADLLRSETVREQIKSRGRVFYLMAAVPTLLGRMEGDGPDQEELSGMLVELEPLCMGAMHFLVAADRPLESVAEDILEKASL